MAKLAQILSAVDWQQNVTEFVAYPKVAAEIERGCHLISVWNAELSFQDVESPALPFLQEMKASTFYVPACMALGLYKPAASSMRAAVENALYFSFFRDHPAELYTLTRSAKFYMSKRHIVEYHMSHTLDFKEKQANVGFVDQLEQWYSGISAIIHGQIPGVWSAKSLSSSAHSNDLSRLANEEFRTAVHLIRYLFLLTTPSDIWEGISPASRRLFLKGLPGPHKAAFSLSTV